MNKKSKIICVIGIQCGGKGTLSKIIQKRYDCIHISGGELIRKQKNPY